MKGKAPLALLLGYTEGAGAEVMTILGARNADELVFKNRFSVASAPHITMDDGSEGRKGFVTDALIELDISGYDRIYTCGPEIMKARVFDILQDAGALDRTEFSLHRYFKCGIGVCRACCMDLSGLRVCKDGHVFNGLQLVGSEFGKYKRSASGQSIGV